MKHIIISFFWVLLYFNHAVESSKILMISLMPSKSHHNLCVPIVDTLAKQGHQVTFITPFPQKESMWREIGVPEIFDFKEKNPISGFSMSKMSIVESISLLTFLQTPISEVFFNNKDVQKFLNDPTEKFDLLILEYFANEYLFGFSAKYNCPIVLLSPFNMLSTLSKMIGNPYSLATVPNAYIGLSTKMNFFERTKNFLVGALNELLDVFLLDNAQKVLYEKHFPKESAVVPYQELKNRISLVLMNTHPSTGGARPLLPNVIEIGGYHLKDPEPLPEDLKKIMDSSKQGVVYFSLGSVLKGAEMDSKMKQSFLKAFSKLKHTVLWKFEEELPEKSNNVIIKDWMPQSAILAHPNLKLFITHGGLLSCTEAANYGVPLVVVPVFGDQPQNGKLISEKGRGLMINLQNVTENSLDWALNEILTNPKYTESAILTQKLFMDRPMKPRDMIAFYVEHVIRTKGAHHLSPPKLSRISLLLLDVLAVILIPIGITLYIIISCFKRLCWRKNIKASEKNKKNN